MKDKKLSKSETEKLIKEISENLNSNNIKKIKKLAMSKNIKLGKLKQKFCKKCYSLFDSQNSQIRIKNKFKIIKCKKCENISRYRLI